MLREIRSEDIEIFYVQQACAEAAWMAAFVREDYLNESSHQSHWEKIMSKPAVDSRTIIHDGMVAGYILKFDFLCKPNIGYWIGKEFWGKGIATAAVKDFVNQHTTRPLYARTAWDNEGSKKVLKKCGFIPHSSDQAFAHGRGEITKEIIWALGS